MNKISNEERKSLVWKYFFEQKWDELKSFFKVLGYACVIFIGLRYIPYLIGLLINKIFPNFFNEICNNMGNGYSGEYVFISFWAVGFLPSLIIIMLVIGSYIFITENWEKANNKVDKEFGEDIYLNE